MTDSSHPNEEVLLDLVLETLPPAEEEQARAHLADCEACAAAHARVEEEQAALRRALGRTPKAPAGLEQRVQAAVRAQPLPVRARTGPRLLLAAAVVLIAAGAWAYVNRPQLTPRQAMMKQVRSSELLALGLGGE